MSTIAAIGTPQGKGGVALIRISGIGSAQDFLNIHELNLK